MPKEIANQEIELLLDTLSEKEKTAVLLRVYDDKTFREIGEELSLSGTRAEKIYKKSIRKLRHPRRLRYLSFIGLFHHPDWKEDDFEVDNFVKWFEDYYNNPPKKYRDKPKSKPKKKPNPTEDDYSGVVHRGFKREVLPGVWMHDSNHNPQVKCPTCNGVGQSESIMGYVSIKQTCLKCEGTGTIHQIKWVN